MYPEIKRCCPSASPTLILVAITAQIVDSVLAPIIKREKRRTRRSDLLVRTMTASTFAAVPTVCEKLRSEYGESGKWIPIQRLPLAYRNTMTAHDFTEQRVACRQSVRQGFVDPVRPKRHLLHFDAETGTNTKFDADSLAAPQRELRRPIETKKSVLDTLTGRCMRLL